MGRVLDRVLNGHIQFKQMQKADGVECCGLHAHIMDEMHIL